MVTGWPGVSTYPSGREGFACPEPHCYYKVGLRPGDTTEHKCPFTGVTRMGWSVAKTLLETVWGQFDDAIDYLKSHQAAEDELGYENYKGQARAYSRMLAVFMAPFLEDENAVAREGLNRWKHRQAGEEYDTPGMGARKFEPATDADVAALDSSRHIPGRKPRVAHKLTPGEVAQLKSAATSGLFSNADLAAVYKISEATVAAILAD